MNITQLAKEIHETARSKGFWDTERNRGEMHMLIISELSEAMEADRKHVFFPKELQASDSKAKENVEIHPGYFEELVKDTFEDEMADAAIRILDTIYSVIPEGSHVIQETFDEWDFRQEPYSNNTSECLLNIVSYIMNADETFNTERLDSYIHHLMIAFVEIKDMCDQRGIDLEWHMKMKMRFNNSRPKMHGKKY